MNTILKVLIAVMIVVVTLIIISQMTINESNETLERTQWVERINR